MGGGLYYDVADDVCLICNPGYELTNENKCIYTAEYWTVEFFVLDTDRHSQSSCTPRVVINFVDPNITPITFSGYSITNTKGIWTTANTITRNFVDDLDEVDYFAIIPECNDAWVGKSPYYARAIHQVLNALWVDATGRDCKYKNFLLL